MVLNVSANCNWRSWMTREQWGRSGMVRAVFAMRGMVKPSGFCELHLHKYCYHTLAHVEQNNQFWIFFRKCVRMFFSSIKLADLFYEKKHKSVLTKYQYQLLNIRYLFRHMLDKIKVTFPTANGAFTNDVNRGRKSWHGGGFSSKFTSTIHPLQSVFQTGG